MVTTTSARPAAWAGVVAVIWVALTTLTPVAPVPPTVTVAGPVSKLVPVIVMAVPPAVGPELGLTAGTGGARAGEGELSAAVVGPGLTPPGAATTAQPPTGGRGLAVV